MGGNGYDMKVILFDLDGTLLPMEQEVFVKTYFKLLAKRLAPLGYEPEKLIAAIWGGTEAMVRNDGSCINEERFWQYFAGVYGEASLKDKSVIDSFYSEEFHQVKAVCGTSPAREIVDFLKARGKTVVLATNPIFPAVATRSRMSWVGLAPEDFRLITTYENSRYCKPNPKYYEEILKTIGCAPEECLMVGNDVGEDMVAERLGMNVFLLTDCLINKRDEDISRWPHGGFAELKAYLQGCV